MMLSARSRATFAALVVAALGSASEGLAQGTLSTQGLGFPPGQLSTQAITMGGAIGEADPLSPLNPAATGLLTTAIILMQAEPEYRTSRIGNQTQRTSVARFPLFLGALPLGGKWAVGVAASTLLDRTWETTTRDSQDVGGETIRFSRNQRSDGSLADLRLSLSFSPAPWFKIGVGGHALSGRDQLFTDLAFDDTARFARDIQNTTVSFGGHAVSVGAHSLIGRIGAIGASYRKGGRLRAYEGNTTVGSGFAPDHLGVSVVYLGISGTALAARVAKDNWSRLEGVASTLQIHEGLDVGVGADVTGPTFGGGPVGVRVGGRWRTLPFSASATAVKEQTWSGGLSFPMARGDVQLNLGVLRASRKGDAGLSESAWTLSTGFAIRP
jgi:hypothetical protein